MKQGISAHASFRRGVLNYTSSSVLEMCVGSLKIGVVLKKEQHLFC